LGKFRGFGWSQNPEGITEATLQGITRNENEKFIGYSYDALTNGKVMQWRGEFDFLTGTIKLKVKEVE
jgi:uroporphyrinogen-III decarboxylase